MLCGTFLTMNLFADQTILTVSRLTSLLKDVLEDNFGQVWVEGEISNLAFPGSGHVYCTLKDSGAMLRCVLFRSSAKALRFQLEEGMTVVVRGRLSVYDQRGDYQLIVEYAEPKGIGALQTAFIQLKERLAEEGLFREARKRPLPLMPHRVGIITSASGAAIHDIITVLKRRHAGINLLLLPVRVQGAGAAQEIASAIDDMNRLQAVDVLIVGRGGGSLEDLWAFNEEVVARSVFHSKIPVISAVGHETDWTICDFVADLRAPTPSAAAELVSAAKEELFQKVNSFSQRLQQSVASQLQLGSERLEGLQRALHDPSRLLGHLLQRLDDLSGRLDRGLHNLMVRRREQLAWQEQYLGGLHPALQISTFRQDLLLLVERTERSVTHQLDHLARAQGEATARLDVLSPLHTLARGFSVVEKQANRRVIKNSDELSTGDKVRIRLHQGSALCLVEEVYNISGGKATT